MQITYEFDPNRFLVKVTIKAEYSLFNTTFSEVQSRMFFVKRDNADMIKAWIDNVRNDIMKTQENLDKIQNVLQQEIEELNSSESEL